MKIFIAAFLFRVATYVYGRVVYLWQTLQYEAARGQ